MDTIVIIIVVVIILIVVLLFMMIFIYVPLSRMQSSVDDLTSQNKRLNERLSRIEGTVDSTHKKICAAEQSIASVRAEVRRILCYLFPQECQ